MGIIVRLLATAAAIWVVTKMGLDVVVSGGKEEWWSRLLVFLGIAAILVLVNSFVRPVVRLLTFPIRLLTLGLFGLVINWAMLKLTAWLSGKVEFGTLEVGGFWKTLLAALVISVLTVFFRAGAPKGH